MPSGYGPVPGACQSLFDAFIKIQTERNELAEELKDAAPGAKGALAAQIKALLPKLGAAEKAYLACAKAHPFLAAKWPVLVTVTFKVDGAILHTTGKDTLTLEFDPAGGKFFLKKFPDLKLNTVHVKGYDDDMTVVMKNSPQGTFTKQTGAASVDTQFTVSHSIFGSWASDLSLHFTTGTVQSPVGAVHGKPMDPAGNLTLAAAGTLVGGSVGGTPVTVTMVGKVSPHP